jgi:hypothetical protein
MYIKPENPKGYIIENEPFSIDSEIEIDTEVDAVQNEVLFDYIPSDLVPLSHCRFIVDLCHMITSRTLDLRMYIKPENPKGLSPKAL